MATRGKGKRLLIGTTYKPAASAENIQVPKPQPRAKQKRIVEENPEEVEETYNLVRLALQQTAKEAFDELEVPKIVTELTEELTINDQDLFWEFASMPEDGEKLQQFYEAIKEEVSQRKIQSKAGLFDYERPPHYVSLVFMSPLLVEERKYEEERDGQLLRKDTPVRNDLMRCEKCGDNRISTRTVQTRSFDEPSSNIRTCFTCGFLWVD